MTPARAAILETQARAAGASSASLSPAPTEARDLLRAAHEDLAGCDSALARLKAARQERFSNVDRCRGILSSAKTAMEAAKARALADPAIVERPVFLVEAQDAVASAQSDFEFASDRLRMVEHELVSLETKRNSVLRETRAAAQAIAVQHAEELAQLVEEHEAHARRERIALRALVLALGGQGVRFGPTAVRAFRAEYPPLEPIVNSGEWRRERQLADQWRGFIEEAIKSPDAPLPEEA
jgi:hypothetical protein